MSHTFKRKIKILQKILNNQCKHIDSCSKIECIIESKNIIIRKNSVISENRNTQIKFPTSDIDNVIIRERAKLFNYNFHEPKGLSEAIQETDIIELRDNLKEIEE